MQCSKPRDVELSHLHQIQGVGRVRYEIDHSLHDRSRIDVPRALLLLLLLLEGHRLRAKVRKTLAEEAKLCPTCSRSSLQAMISARLMMPSMFWPT